MAGGVVLLMLVLGQPVAAAPTSRPEGPPALVVQVVDPLWLPMPSIQVTVAAVGSDAERKSVRTGRQGFGEFWLPRGVEYSIEVHSPGFRRRRVDHLRIRKEPGLSPTAYVQIQLEPRGLGRAEE